MAAATCPSQRPYGLGPGGPDLQPRAAPGPSGAARPQPQQQPQQQKHSKPFFYVQPQQPYVPMQSLQWPLPVHMPMSYNPYFGFPGLGYGMPMMPHYQPNPYVEPPSFIVPHTHLHLMDYRRMVNPQYYQTMAYHSRRFHYKHNSQPRETTSSQVQTEPLVSPQRTDGLSSSQVKSPDVLDARGAPSIELPFPSSAMQKAEDHSTQVSGSAAPSTSTAPSTGSFTIQTEEVRIECCTTPAGLQLLHARDTAEMSRDFSNDVVTCSSVLQRHVLHEEASSLPMDQAEQALQVCPDILMGGTLGEKIPAAQEDLRNRTDFMKEPFGCESQEATCNAVEKPIREEDQTGTSSDLNLKIIHLPFDAKYLDELRKMESSVWSNEETLIPSPEPQLQDVSTDSHDETLIPEAELPMFSEDVVTEEVPDTPPREKDEDENQVSSLETLGDEMMAIHPSIGLSEDTHVAEEIKTAEGTLGPNSPLMADRSRRRRDSKFQDYQETSFESLPAYLPSTSWFSDFDNVYICSKVRQAPENKYKPESSSGLDVPTRRGKLELDHRDALNARRLKDRYKHKGKADHWSLSDHEYCLSRSFIKNNTFVSKRDQLCSRCVEKHGICASPGAGLDRQNLKRKAVPFQQRNDEVSRAYKVCKSRSNRQLAKRGSSLDVCSSHHAFDTEGESSENSRGHTGPKWLDANEPVKRPLLSRQNVDRHPTPGNQRLREKSCLPSEAPRQHAVWERLRHCPHGHAIREMDENCTVPTPLQDQWRNHVYVKQRWKAESSWKAVMQSEDIDVSNSDARSQLLIHRKSQPLSQGTRTKDTRC